MEHNISLNDFTKKRGQMQNSNASINSKKNEYENDSFELKDDENENKLTSDLKKPSNDKEMLLKALYEKISNCTKCELSNTKNNYVFGQGSSNAKILFVGEAPGFWEDQKGEPFVGRAGKFLDMLLEHIGLNRNDVYIANILKCRPPENRDPTASEILACAPFLDELIRVINPKIIAALGRHSMGYLFEKFNIEKEVISKIHGEHFNIYNDLGEFFVIALYHPAVALYNPGMRDVLKKDFEKIKELIS